MLKPSLARNEIYRLTRVVLVRQMINLGQLSINVSPYHIHLKGSLARLPGVSSPLTSKCICEMLDEIRRTSGINQINAEFDNWQLTDQDGQVWAKTESGTEPLARSFS